MKLKITKCTFGVTSGKFLGFLVHQRGIEANTDKIKAILEMDSPRNLQQLQGLNGRIAALNRFVSRSTDKCLSFFKILRKKWQFEWIEECEATFKKLKRYLGVAPLLSKPIVGDELFLYLAVSDTAVSSALIKEEDGRQSPIYYTSKSMVDAKLIYPQVEKLALTLVTPAWRLRPYFLAHIITVLTNFPLRQILQRPDISGRLVKWAVELSEYDIHYKPRTSMKGHAVADFIAELTPAKPQVCSIDPQLVKEEQPWTLYVDGSSNFRGCETGLLLISPDKERFEYALRFNFHASSNKAEYEALLARLKVARYIGVKNILILSDSQLIVSQVKEEFQAREPRMAKYLSRVKDQLGQFSKFEIRQIPCTQNVNADALARLAAAYGTDLGRTISVEILLEPSIKAQEKMDIDEQRQSEENWMSHLIKYLKDGILPDEMIEGQQLQRQAARYVLKDESLYKRGYSLPLLKCLTLNEADYVMREIHEGVCGNHFVVRSLSHKIVRQGYYWPTMLNDTTHQKM
ncbi:uncharacterized protein LOC111025623 [Momordica charantia]|uniref:Uncharacterized protein LOC111025623 n=1 Tax=Momordica charantia TaxID=3673 RepID=A0A6J1E1Q5_MOMCH|nr:uncharacterized protein LOC111025623 [Momordica charantia]